MGMCNGAQRLPHLLYTAPITVHILTSVYHTVMNSPQCRTLQKIECLSDCFVQLHSLTMGR